jgi:hypothetical protein
MCTVTMNRSSWYNVIAERQQFLRSTEPNGGVLNQSGHSWSGRVQIGSRDYPPSNGDIIDVAVSVVTKAEADALMREAGVVMRPEPVGNVSAKAENVRVVITAKR